MGRSEHNLLDCVFSAIEEVSCFVDLSKSSFAKNRQLLIITNIDRLVDRCILNLREDDREH